MSVPADEATRHRQVAVRFTELVGGASDWDTPSPVEGWAARDVVEHLVTWLTGLLGSHGVPLPGAAVGSAPVARWQAHVVGVQGPCSTTRRPRDASSATRTSRRCR